jgi:sugar phosphate isomerase/epimerase
MLTPGITRRQILKAGATALPLAALLPAGADAKNDQRRRVTLGIATAGFFDRTNAQLAAELKREGLHTVQLFLTQSDSNFWRYITRTDLSALTPQRCRAIADTYRAEGLSLHSIGVYPNLIHPDETERKLNLAYFGRMIEIGHHMGVRRFITEAGDYRPSAAAGPMAFDLRPDVWKSMVATAKRLAGLADAYDATVLFEPSAGSFLATAKRTRMFLEEVNSPRIRALLDAANLLELNDLEEMFDQLAPWTDCLHAKDYKLHTDQGVPAGEGDLDYRKLVTLAADRTPGAPLIMEYVGSKNYRQALGHLRRALRAAGVSEG